MLQRYSILADIPSTGCREIAWTLAQVRIKTLGRQVQRKICKITVFPGLDGGDWVIFFQCKPLPAKDIHNYNIKAIH